MQYVLQMRLINESHKLLNVLGRLLFMEHMASENISSAPCLEFDMRKTGHACIAASLGRKAWPPDVGYSFACWIQCTGLRSQQADIQETMKLRLFSIGSTDSENAFGEELYLQEDGMLSLAANSTLLSSSCLNLEEGKWYHLAVVQNKRDVVVAEHFSSIFQVYLNGKLIDTEELTYTPMLVERDLQVTIGTSLSHSRASDLQWRLRSWYLFQESLSAEFIQFMYMLARGSTYLLQDSDDPDCVLNEAGRGDKVDVLDSSAEFRTERLHGLESIWDVIMVEKYWSQLCGKKLLCAFNAARIEALPASQTLTLLNLVDPLSVAATQNGMPSFGHLYGDVSICRRCIIGNVICPVTDITVILALIETAKTRNTLHIALTLLASALYQNPQCVQKMKACKGYEMLSLFLYRNMSWFDTQCLEILFSIALSEDPLKPKDSKNSIPSKKAISQTTVVEINPAEFQEKLPSVKNQSNIHDLSGNRDTPNFDSEHATNTAATLPISGAISDADIVEHVLLNWTIWVTAPVSFQLEIMKFFEDLISVYKHKDHNLTVLRERNIVKHLLEILRRDDVELLVLEKFVILLAIILEHKLLDSELESVTTCVLTTFDPPEVVKPLQVMRETMSKSVTLRNILLEMLIDLQVTIFSEELLEQWHKNVTSRLITYFLDDAVHPTSMMWIITLLGLCLISSPIFSLKFESSGGYKALARVLSSYHEFLDIYYTLFCLIFKKPIYPKLPEISTMDFEALMVNNEDFGDLKYTGLLDSVVAMVKTVFNQLRVQANLAQQAVNISQTSAADHVEESRDIIEELGFEEASRQATYDASSLGWEASATNGASVLKLMANLAKMFPSFSTICERTEFLESCVDLYFSIVRSYMVLKLTRKPNIATTSTKSPNLASEGNDSTSTKSGSHMSSTEYSDLLTTSNLMLEIESFGYNGEPCSVGATAVLDLISELLSASLIGHINPVLIMESLFKSVPLYLDYESVLTFQELCLSRVMIYLERRLIHSVEESNQKLDLNNLWSNIGSFCNLIVDCVYMGVFPQPSTVMRVLEFCFSMLYSAKKQNLIEQSSLPWTGLVSILRGIRPLDAILKSTNRMILHCFLPTLHDLRVDICVVLELIHAHKEIIFHPSNVDTDLYCCLCINVISLFSDPRTDARNSAMGILKYMLVHCRAALEDVLILKPDQKKPLDVLNQGFEKLLTENMSTFTRWFHSNEQDINHVLQQFAGIRWTQFIAESEKFKKEKCGLLEDHWAAKMGKKVEQAAEAELVYWNHCIERRSTLAAMRIAACTDSEHACRRKHDMVVHAESEWRSRFEQLGHEHKVEPVNSLVWEDYWPL